MADFNYRKLSPEGASPREISSAVNLLIDGKNNAKGTFTLTASASTTVVTDVRVGEDSVILWSPMTNNAATELSHLYISSRGKNTFTLTHRNNPQTDRTYIYTVTG